MIILLKRPMRHWDTNRPSRVMHDYKLFNILTRRYCRATYKGAPHRSAIDRPWFAGGVGLPGLMRSGWLIVKPPIGLPAGI